MTRLAGVYGVLAALNIGAWLWTVAAFHGKPVPLAIAATIYGLGLRHAVDADHIAAIDNVTRKLMQANRRPVSVGFFFAMGHSTVVIAVSGAVAAAADLLDGIARWKAIGVVVSTLVSALLLFAIAAVNLTIFASLYRSFRRLRGGEGGLDLSGGDRGLLSRICRPAFRLVTRSWHMFPLGLLFGLGFDTATEVAVFGVAAAQAAQGLSMAAILVFPALFAAAMSLVDTTDGVLMLAAYDWAFVNPLRKVYYNMAITLVSVAVALFVGGVETLELVGDRLALNGLLWRLVAAANGNFNGLGFLIVGIFMAAWLLSYLVYRLRKADRPATKTARQAEAGARLR